MIHASPNSRRKTTMGIKSFSSAFLLGVLAISVLVLHERALGQQETILHNFGETQADGMDPYAGLIFGSDGNLYGTTAYGGDLYGGTAFQLVPNGTGGWSYNTIYSFDWQVVWNIYAGLTLGPSNTLYGVAGDGYAGDQIRGGTVFSLIPATNGSWTKKNLFQFPPSGLEGIFPYTNLISDTYGNFYGTAQGGRWDGGVAYELVATSNGLTYKVLHNFAAMGTTNASVPAAPLAFDSSGNLYGTTVYGGTYNTGTVFELVAQKNGAWSEKVLYSFNTGGEHQSVSGLAVDSSGNLYGTTSLGGAYGAGMVFELARGERASWSEKILHSFGDGQDGSYPNAGVVFDPAGNLFGTTGGGGAENGGTVFELEPAAGGQWTETILYAFGSFSDDGFVPYGNLILDADGNLYGTTLSGGAYSAGTVFEITP
jgi:uncharacterized repeat protein (TIGR03803 family)